MANQIVEDMVSGKTHISLTKEVTTYMLISSWALLSPMRQYVIKNIKAPLQEAIEKAHRVSDIVQALLTAARGIPGITKDNTAFINTHSLLDEFEKLKKYHHNPNRGPMCEAAFKVGMFEYEHDGYYAFIIDMLLIDIALEIAKGNWRPRFTKFPLKHCWSGPDLPDIETIRQQMREALKAELPDRRPILKITPWTRG